MHLTIIFYNAPYPKKRVQSICTLYALSCPECVAYPCFHTQLIQRSDFTLFTPTLFLHQPTIKLQPLPNTGGITRKTNASTLIPLLTQLDSVHVKQATLHYWVKLIVESGHSSKAHPQPGGHTLNCTNMT